MDASLFILIVTAVVFVLAGFVKGVIGLGLPTLSMGLLVLVMPPARAAALLVVPSLVTNVWQMVTGPSLRPITIRLWSMMLGICLGTWAAAGWLSLSENAATALGLALILYAITGLVSVRISVPARAEPFLSPLVGAVTGAITAATGVFVIPAVPYLHAIGLERDELVQALGVSFTVSTLALAVNLASQGALPTELAVESGWALLPALAGMWAGQLIRGRTKPDVFRVWLFVGLGLLGAHLSLRSFL